MIILLPVLLFVIPFMVGIAARKILDYKGRGITEAFLCGVLTMLSISGALQLMLLLLKRPFSEYMRIYPLLLIVLALVGGVVLFFELREAREGLNWKEHFLGFFRYLFYSAETKVFSLLTLTVFILCVLRIVLGVPDVSGDFTLETVRTTLATDTIYQYNSFTGQEVAEGMPIRQQILTLPFFLTFLSEISGMDAALLVYKIFPCYVLMLAVLVYSRWAGTLFVNRRDLQSGFLFLISFMIFVGDYAGVAPASLLLHQGFTGNALCAAVVIPFAIYLCVKGKWSAALLCVVAELFLIWTTYGLGYCVLVMLLFAGVSICGRIKGKVQK